MRKILEEILVNLVEKMRCKWYSTDEPSSSFSEVHTFWPKSNWKPLPGHICVELFLIKLESELFSSLPGKPQAYNLTKEEWLAIQSLAEDRSIIIKPVLLYETGRITSLNDITKLVIHLLTLKSRSTMMNYYHNLQKRVTSFLKDYMIISWLVRRNLNIFHVTLRIPIV